MDSIDQTTTGIASMSLDNGEGSKQASTRIASFLGIPVELRLVIYDLAITPRLLEYELYYSKLINLAESQPPNKNLLLVCQQTYNEAVKVYQQNYRNYWNSHRFCLRNRAEDLETILTYDDKALDSITSLEIVEWYLCDESMEMNMIKQRRGWYWWCPCHGGCECAFGYIEKDSDGGYVWNNIEAHLAEEPGREEVENLQEHGLPLQRDLHLRAHLEALRESHELFTDETLLPDKSQQELEEEEEEEEERRLKEYDEADEADVMADLVDPILRRR